MKMNSEYGVAQQEMHLTYIKQEFGYLGPHELIIEVGYGQHVVFQKGGDISLWMNLQERVATNFSKYYELQLKYKTKAELIGNLKIYAVSISVVKGKRLGIWHDRLEDSQGER